MNSTNRKQPPERIELLVPAGRKGMLQRLAEERHETLCGLINALIAKGLYMSLDEWQDEHENQAEIDDGWPLDFDSEWPCLAVDDALNGRYIGLSDTLDAE